MINANQIDDEFLLYCFCICLALVVFILIKPAIEAYKRSKKTKK